MLKYHVRGCSRHTGETSAELIVALATRRLAWYLPPLDILAVGIRTEIFAFKMRLRAEERVQRDI